MTSPAVKLDAAAAEVALGEAQAVLALVQDVERRGRLADLVAAVEDGELGEDDAQALEEIIELGLSTGRIRGIYGPEGEQAEHPRGGVHQPVDVSARHGSTPDPVGRRSPAARPGDPSSGSPSSRRTRSASSGVTW